MLKVRLAVKEDLDGIMEVEKEEFGALSEEAMASREMMEDRIKFCNNIASGWFWVAEYEGRIVGDIILQPTNLAPSECTSWTTATDDGTLRKTFDPMGKNFYVVSLAASHNSPPGTSIMLMHASLVHWAWHRGFYMFSSRMPGYAKAYKKNGISPEKYWLKRRDDGGPKDWMLYLYWQMSGGVYPTRLLKNSFPPDSDSHGHGALFVLNNPYIAIFATAEALYGAGIMAGKKQERRTK